MFDTTSYPQFHFPLHLSCSILSSLLLNSTRNFHMDANIVLQRNSSQIQLLGIENIPKVGSTLVTLNHYARDGFSIIWAALAIASQLPKEQLWLMTNAWTNRTNGLDIVRTKITRCLFRRIADVYGFITTPAMPPVAREMVDRALSIRAVFQFVKSHSSAIVCLAPEGRDYPYGIIGQPPPGTGKFIYQLSNYLETVLPVGVFEKDKKLVISFGHAYHLKEICDLNDEKISRIVMERIRIQLPNYFEMAS